MAYYGHPRTNYRFYPYPVVNPNQYLNPYHHSDPNGNQFFNPYHNPNHYANSLSNLNRNPYANPNPRPQYAPYPTMRPNPNSSSTSGARVVSIPVHFINYDSEELQPPTHPPAPVVPVHFVDYDSEELESPTHPLFPVVPAHYVNSGSEELQSPTHPLAPLVPVHFVDSDLEELLSPTHPLSPIVYPRLSSEMAALKLQKVIRGFLVRKNWRIVQKIEAEAKAIGEEVARDEAVLAKEVRARIRIGEMLMNLLFRLDSVRGVRDYRKKVIRKVISLQELVDSIRARGDRVEADAIEVDKPDVAIDSVQLANAEENKMVETVDAMEDTPNDVSDSIETNKCEEEGPSSDAEQHMMVEEAMNPVEVFDPTETLELDENVTRSNTVDQSPEPPSLVGTSNKENIETKMMGVREVMEKVVEEGEKMKNLMQELCKSSACQWRLMEGLVDRVQRLERDLAENNGEEG